MSILVVRGKVRRPWRTRHIPSDIIVTRPNGEVIVIPAGADKVKRKAKPKARNSITAMSEQDLKAIELEERRAATLRAIGSIHLDDN